MLGPLLPPGTVADRRLSRFFHPVKIAFPFGTVPSRDCSYSYFLALGTVPKGLSRHLFPVKIAPQFGTVPSRDCPQRVAAQPEDLSEDLLSCFLRTVDLPDFLSEDRFLFRYLFRVDFLTDSFRHPDPDRCS